MLKVLFGILLATSLVTAFDNAWSSTDTIEQMLTAQSRVLDLNSMSYVQQSFYPQIASYIVKAWQSSPPSDFNVVSHGRLTWFERLTTVGHHESGVLLSNKDGHRQLLELNVTLPSDWSFKSLQSTKSQAVDLTVMSFNLRYGTANDGANSWPFRDHLVFDLLKKYDSDIVGVQEALKFQIDEILTSVPGYAFLGVGRDDGQEAGEYSAIFYRTSKFSVLESGTFWFCDRPNEPGCTSYGNVLPRIATFARFMDRMSLQSFYLYNCHLDHMSVISREKSVQQMLQHIYSHVKNGELVLVTGDFNAGESETCIHMMKQGGFVDTFRVLYPNATEVGTFNGFKGDANGAKIDYIFASASDVVGGFIRTLDAAIIRDNDNGQYPSDHFPVWAHVQLP